MKEIARRELLIMLHTRINVECYVLTTSLCDVPATSEFYVAGTSEFYVAGTSEFYVAGTSEFYVAGTSEFYVAGTSEFYVAGTSEFYVAGTSQSDVVGMFQMTPRCDLLATSQNDVNATSWRRRYAYWDWIFLFHYLPCCVALKNKNSEMSSC